MPNYTITNNPMPELRVALAVVKEVWFEYLKRPGGFPENLYSKDYVDKITRAINQHQCDPLLCDAIFDALRGKVDPKGLFKDIWHQATLLHRLSEKNITYDQLKHCLAKKPHTQRTLITSPAAVNATTFVALAITAIASVCVYKSYRH